LWQFAAVWVTVMRRVIVIALSAAALGGCSSLSWDTFKPTPQVVQLQLESVPSGAEARTSTGQSCKTPCSVGVPLTDAPFSVSFGLPKFQPETVPVQIINIPGDIGSPDVLKADPNPVVVQLKPAGPPPKPVRAKPRKPKPPKPPPGQTNSPFPDPSAPPPGQTR
jgi:hypothetical protein